MRSEGWVVFDTNIFISAIIFGGNSRACLELIRSGEIELVVSRALLLELARKLKQKFAWPRGDIEEVIKAIGVLAEIVEPKEKLLVIKEDTADNRVLEAAVAGKVTWIISGDKHHLLPLGAFRGIRIVSPAEFLRYFSGPKS